MIHKNLELISKNLINNKTTTVKLTSYLPDNFEAIDNKRKRKTIVLCPGGGYQMTSDREAEPVALKLASHGFNVFVLRYTCTPSDIVMPLVELANAVSTVRKNSEEYNVDADKIIIGGFSAGGHLTANYSTLYSGDFMRELTDMDSEEIKPNGVFLGYPAITYTADKSHFDENSVWDDYGVYFKDVSQQVNKDVPPAFIWHTFTDTVCPVTDSLKMATKYYEVGVSCELHVFPEGRHGLSLANNLTSHDDNEDFIISDVQIWFDLFLTWLKK